MLNKLYKWIAFMIAVIFTAGCCLFEIPAYADETAEKIFYSEDLKIRYTVVASWNNEQHISVELTNIGENNVENWELYYDINGEINSIWNAEIITDENNIQHIKCMDYNSIILPGSSVVYGYLISGSGELPDSISIFDGSGEDNGEKSGGEIYYKDIESEDDIAYDNDGERYFRNQLILTVSEDKSFEETKEFVRSIDSDIVGYIEVTNEYQIEFTYDLDINALEEIASNLESYPFIEEVSVNYIFDLSESSIPNDPESQMYNGVRNENWNLYAINAPRAWAYYDKMETVKLGLMDGNFYPHDDITFKKIYSKALNYTYHGTFDAGIMAAKFDNNIGISGVCPKNELYAYCMGNSSSVIKYMAALSNLIQDDVKVINISMNAFGGKEEKKELINNGDAGEIRKYNKKVKKINTTLQRLINKGYDFVIVVAAGNDGNIGFNAKYANYLSGIDSIVKCNIIVVGNCAQGTDGYELYHTSNIGERVDVVAPGENILSLFSSENYIGGKYTITSNYSFSGGTSMAAPHVSGIAGMMYSVNPDISGTEIKEIIKGTSKLRTVKDSHGYEYGIADARLAVSTAYYHQADNPDKIVFGKLEDKNDSSNKFANVKIAVSYDGQERSIYSDDNGEFEIVIPKETETGSLKYQIDGYAANAKVEAEYLRSTAVVNVDLAPVSITVKGKVTEHNKTTNITKPLVGYTVTAVSKDNPGYTAKGTTNALGEYEISLGNAGDYTVIFTDKLQYDFYADNGEYFFDAVMEAENDDDGSGGDKEDGGNGENTGGGSENDPPKDWETEVTEENSIVISTEVDDPSKDNDNTKTGGDFGVDLKQGIYIDCGEYTCRVYVEDYEYSSSEIWTAYITNKLKYDIYKNGVLISSYFTHFWYKRVVSSFDYTTWIYTEYVSSVGVKTVRENGRNNIYLTYTIKNVHNPVRGEPDSVFERNILMISGSDAVPTVRNH